MTCAAGLDRRVLQFGINLMCILEPGFISCAVGLGNCMLERGGEVAVI